MNFIGRTKRTYEDYQTSYFYKKHFMSKEEIARQKKIEADKNKQEKQKEKEAKVSLKEILNQRKEKQKRDEMGK